MRAARPGDRDGTTPDPAIEASLQGLLDSMEINVVSSRAKLPAEEPRLQPVPAGWAKDGAERTRVAGGKRLDTAHRPWE